MELHPLCTLFPRLGDAEFAALVSDLKANGQRHPIIIYDGMILDGGNRYRACVEAGLIPEYEEFNGADPADYVLSVNLHRRHMSPGQQAAAVAAAQDWSKSQKVGRPGNSATLHYSGEEPESSGAGNGATLHLDRSVDRAAKSGASVRTQKMADKVAKANPDLVARVSRGEVSLPDAVKEVDGKPKKAEEPDDLDEALADIDPVEEWKKTAKELEDAQRIIESLSQTDHGAELKRQIEARKVAEHRLSDEMSRCAKMDKEIRQYGKWFRELREIAGVETRSEITRILRDGVQALKETVAL